MMLNIHLLDLTAATTLSVPWQKFWTWFNGPPLHIIVILVIALVAQRLGSRAIAKTMNRLANSELVRGTRNVQARQKARAKTTGTILSSNLNAVIWVITIGRVWGECGLNLSQLIASAGVIGIARGHGDQKLARQVRAGLYIRVEDK